MRPGGQPHHPQSRRQRQVPVRVCLRPERRGAGGAGDGSVARNGTRDAAGPRDHALRDRGRRARRGRVERSADRGRGRQQGPDRRRRLLQAHRRFRPRQPVRRHREDRGKPSQPARFRHGSIRSRLGRHRNPGIRGSGHGLGQEPEAHRHDHPSLGAGSHPARGGPHGGVREPGDDDVAVQGCPVPPRDHVLGRDHRRRDLQPDRSPPRPGRRQHREGAVHPHRPVPGRPRRPAADPGADRERRRAVRAPRGGGQGSGGRHAADARRVRTERADPRHAAAGAGPVRLRGRERRRNRRPVGPPPRGPEPRQRGARQPGNRTRSGEAGVQLRPADPSRMGALRRRSDPAAGVPGAAPGHVAVRPGHRRVAPDAGDARSAGGGNPEPGRPAVGSPLSRAPPRPHRRHDVWPRVRGAEQRRAFRILARDQADVLLAARGVRTHGGQHHGGHGGAHRLGRLPHPRHHPDRAAREPRVRRRSTRTRLCGAGSRRLVGRLRHVVPFAPGRPGLEPGQRGNPGAADPFRGCPTGHARAYPGARPVHGLRIPRGRLLRAHVLDAPAG